MLPILLSSFQTFNSSLPYNIPPGFFLTTWDRIRVFGAICFILGFSACVLIDFVCDSIKKGKAKNKALKDGESQEGNRCQTCQFHQP